MSIEQLAAGSAAIVVGAVADATLSKPPAAADRDHRRRHQTLHGSVGAVLTLHELDDGARFDVGEEVVSSSPRRCERVRVSHGALELRLVETAARGLEARANYEDASFLLAPGEPPPRNAIPWQEIERATKGRRPQGLRLRRRNSSNHDAGSGALAGFRITQAGRFFEPDEGLPVDFRIDFRGDMTLGFVQSKQAIDAAMAAWTAVAGATITLRDRGVTDDLGRVCPD
jgi:hypothetical protein